MEVFTKVYDIFVIVLDVSASPSYSKELAIWDALFAIPWVGRIIVQIIVSISRFAVQRSVDFVVLKMYYSVKEICLLI